MLKLDDSVSLSRIRRIFDLVCLDVILGLLLAWLIVDNPRRWPILLVLIPLLIYANVALGRRAIGARKTTSYALPAIYLSGFIFGIWWSIADFAWWKFGFLIVPLAFFILSFTRIRQRQKLERSC